jgi:hypothetical protein
VRWMEGWMLLLLRYQVDGGMVSGEWMGERRYVED